MAMVDPIPTPFTISKMSRTRELSMLLSQIRAIRFSYEERRVIIDRLHHRRSIREIAAAHGVTMRAVHQRFRRARARARRAGLVIPLPRRKTVRVSLERFRLMTR